MHLVVLPGDGIGPEITAATLDILRDIDTRLRLGLTFEEHEVGLAALQRRGTTVPPGIMEACRAADGIILGPVSHSDYPPRAQGGINISAELRIVLDLYANIRPARSREGLPHWGRTPMDLVIVRENTEGFYADRNMHLGPGEFRPTEDVTISVRVITRRGSSKVARAALELARTRRKKLTFVHKDTVFKLGCGMFVEEVRKAAQDFPDVAVDDVIVDTFAMRLVRDPQTFDVVVTTNMFGDILSDEASELSGSLGLAGAVNASAAHCMAQAQHGSAPDIAGQDKANPISLILSAAMLLDWHARRGTGRDAFARAAAAIEAGVDSLARDPARRTGDLGGPLGTAAYARALKAEVAGRLG